MGFFSLSLYSMPTFLCKWAINVTLACEKHLFFSTNSSKCREKGQWVKKWLHPIKAVAAELTNMRQHRASCANWRYAFCMQLWVTQMLFSREALLEKTLLLKTFEEVHSWIRMQNPSLSGNLTWLSTLIFGMGRVLTIQCCAWRNTQQFQHCEGFEYLGCSQGWKTNLCFSYPSLVRFGESLDLADVNIR